ncbi:MAG: delta-60 repeat domain-containing protein, partial [Actinomycetota bacterium]
GANDQSLCPGAPDRPFGDQGQVVTDFGGLEDQALAVAIQGDGRIIVAGQARGGKNADFAIARYLRDGSLDPSFGEGGKRTTDFAHGTDSATDVAVQIDGRIVVVGTATDRTHHTQPAVARYMPSGARDRSFSDDGRLIIRLPFENSRGAAVAIQPDGKILIAGSAPPDQVVAVRLNGIGSLDPTFGSGGVSQTTLPDRADAYAVAAALLPNERFLILAQTLNSQKDQWQTALLQYLPDGDPDPSFAQGGVALRQMDYTLSVAMAVQPDGRILVAGRCQCGSQIYLDRYLPDGRPDSSFGEDGTVAPRQAVTPHSIVLEPDGRIVVASDSYLKEVLVRFSPDGEIDDTFGRNHGWERQSFPTGHGGTLADAALTSGKLLVVGSLKWAAGGTDGRFVVARYWLEPRPRRTTSSV